MYTRGQFAIIGKTTRKALRIYEEKGILIPDRHDEMNDYRYYSNKQLDDLFIILKYKKLGFSLQEIKEILIIAGVLNVILNLFFCYCM